MYLGDIILVLIAAAIYVGLASLLIMVPIKLGTERGVSDTKTLRTLSWGSLVIPILWPFALGFACFSKAAPAQE